MKMLFSTLLLLAAAVGFTMLAQRDPGYILLSYDGWSVESSLSLFILALGVTILVSYFVLRLLFGTLHIPGRLGYWRRHRRSLRARAATNRGLLALAEGNWPKAERFLSRFAGSSDTPLLNYLGAARAAQKQGADGRRDQYLSQAFHMGGGMYTARGYDLLDDADTAGMGLAFQRQVGLARSLQIQRCSPGRPRGRFRVEMSLHPLERGAPVHL